MLETLDAYLGQLVTQWEKAEKVRKANESETDPDLLRPLPDFPRLAWEHLKELGWLPAIRRAVPYSGRKDGMGNDVPNVCLKVPTGGGKTLLAAYGVSHIMGRYFQRNHGIVLWIVPNDAIYSQAKKQIGNREHPYRQILDRAAAGRVKLLETDDPLNRLDVESNLCVMLLMLQAANRETKQTLRLFRDRGNVHGFFPASDDIPSHFELLGRVPNLSCYGNRNNMGAIAHDSLGNVLRLLRPLIVMDEGHKAYTSSAMSTLYDFNPRFVLELSATPKDRIADNTPMYTNWLVDVRGADLQREEMIKLPLNVKVKAGDDWKDCVRESYEHLNNLQDHADKLRSNTERYIRPILLVQVERTGKEQRERGAIHAEDVREFLLTLGMEQAQIAVKSSEKDELRTLENNDLMSPSSQVRVIITKQALQEGWDCPFAYVLCTLAASRNLSAMTQLVGRILRQPDATKTPDPVLNECYVFCHHAKTKYVVEAIKDGLERDGMGDLAQQIREWDSAKAKQPSKRVLHRREKFCTLDIYLPLVNWVDSSGARPLDYERDILSRIDWSLLDVKHLAETLAKNVNPERSHMLRLVFSEGASSGLLEATKIQIVQELLLFDTVYATRLITDLVPNPWIARAFIGELVDALRQRGFDDKKLGEASSYVLEELRVWLHQQRDLLAERLFMSDVAEEKIQFRLRADRTLWRIPTVIETDSPVNSAQLLRDSGEGIAKSLFSPVYRDDFNGSEAEFACYLDEGKALRWWHRNVAKNGNYWIQGWRRNRVYPDFIFAHERIDGADRILVWETKGDQLEGNLDTRYKRKLLEIVSKSYRSEEVTNAGRLQLTSQAGEIIECDLLLMSEWKTEVLKKLGNE